MRKLALALVLFAASALLAQPPASARVTFEQRWPTRDKNNVAFTGTKTLRYEDPALPPSSISYNYSSSPELARLTTFLEGVSETIQLSQSLQFQLRFDKLALDSSLRRAEELVSSRQLYELQILTPILTRIANDPTIMNIARQRARRILQVPTPTKLK